MGEKVPFRSGDAEVHHGLLWYTCKNRAFDAYEQKRKLANLHSSERTRRTDYFCWYVQGNWVGSKMGCYWINAYDVKGDAISLLLLLLNLIFLGGIFGYQGGE